VVREALVAAVEQSERADGYHWFVSGTGSARRKRGRELGYPNRQRAASIRLRVRHGI